jgi:hypothetical protein
MDHYIGAGSEDFFSLFSIHSNVLTHARARARNETSLTILWPRRESVAFSEAVMQVTPS